MIQAMTNAQQTYVKAPYTNNIIQDMTIATPHHLLLLYFFTTCPIFISVEFRNTRKDRKKRRRGRRNQTWRTRLCRRRQNVNFSTPRMRPGRSSRCLLFISSSYVFNIFESPFVGTTIISSTKSLNSISVQISKSSGSFPQTSNLGTDVLPDSDRTHFWQHLFGNIVYCGGCIVLNCCSVVGNILKARF